MISKEKKSIGSKKFKGDEYAIPIYTPRSTYNSIRANDEMLLNDLTLNFDPFTISILKNEFRERDGEMKMLDFIMIIKDHLIHWQLDIPNRDRKLIRCLSLLFKDIDLNGNDNMEWDEFTNYIIEKAAVLNTMKSKNEEIKSYHPSSTKLSIKFPKLIAKCIHIPLINRLAFFEEESDVVHFADPENGQIDPKQSLHVKISEQSLKSDGINPPTHNATRAMILDLIFIDGAKYNLLVTSSNDGVIRMFKYSSNRFKPADDSNQRDHEIVYDNAQMIIVWDKIDEILYSGQRDGVIKVWDQKSEPQFSQLGGKSKKEKKNGSIRSDDFSESDSHIGRSKRRRMQDSFSSDGSSDIGRPVQQKQSSKGPGFGLSRKKKENLNEGHTDVITAMLPLNKLQFLASASLDKKIILWDTIENRKKREYKGYHKKGIISLDFNESLILLISGGFDHEIFVWNPYIDAPVHNLSGHASPIISLKFINNPLHVVSLDTDFTLKIWDVKKFKCIDTMMMRENSEEKKSFLPQGICVLERPLKLIIPGKNLFFLDYDRNNNLTSADENVSICAKFIPSTLTLLTPVGNKIKLWNLLTGEVKKIFSDLTKNDISCVNLDEKGKRFMMGDTEGFVGVYNVNNGALLKALTKHKAEISWFVQSEKFQVILSASVDNTIKVHDDKELGESEFLRNFQIADANITSLTFDMDFGRIVMGTNLGMISLYEATTGKGNDEFKDKDSIGEEITAMVFLNNYSSLIYANSSGQIKLLAVSPIVTKNVKLASVDNPFDDTDDEKHATVTKLIYCDKTQRLFLADDHHYVKCLNISKLIKTLHDCLDSINEKSKADPVIPKNWISVLWQERVHDDIIRSLEYIEAEDLLITTCVDKTVRIFKSDTGALIESLRQRKDGERIKPIAYKKVESEEIYTPRMQNRIDSYYKEKERFKARREKEIQKQIDQGIIDSFDLDEEFDKYFGHQKVIMEAFKEYEEQEFDPSYYFKKKLDLISVKDKNSNSWKLYLKFENYYKNFEEEVDEICKDVGEAEKSLSLAKKAIGNQNPEDVMKGSQNLLKLSHDMPEPKKRAEKFVKYSEKFVSVTADEERKLMEKVKKEQLERKKKQSSKPYKNLYKQGLKKDMIKKMNVGEKHNIKLSQSEVDAAERLAAALANYDKDDPRSLLFTGFDIKKTKKRKVKKQE